MIAKKKKQKKKIERKVMGGRIRDCGEAGRGGRWYAGDCGK